MQTQDAEMEITKAVQDLNGLKNRGTGRARELVIDEESPESDTA